MPHSAQRYDTVGDWVIVDGDLHIISSDLGDGRMNLCILVHELVEAALCLYDGVDEQDVTRFDMLYEDRRADVRGDEARLSLLKEFGCNCFPTDTSEPGEDIHAPYRKQHAVADVIERLLAHELKIPWAEYNAKVEVL